MDQWPNRDQSMHLNKSDIQHVVSGHYWAAICKWDCLWLISVFTVLAPKFQRNIVALIDLPKSCFESIYSCNQRLLERANLPFFKIIGNNSDKVRKDASPCSQAITITVSIKLKLFFIICLDFKEPNEFQFGSIKSWNGSKALQTSNDELDCYTYGPIIY